jgi:hypothetical protein
VARRVLELHVDRFFYPGGAYQRIRGRSRAEIQVCKSRLTTRLRVDAQRSGAPLNANVVPQTRMIAKHIARALAAIALLATAAAAETPFVLSPKALGPLPLGKGAKVSEPQLEPVPTVHRQVRHQLRGLSGLSLLRSPGPKRRGAIRDQIVY